MTTSDLFITFGPLLLGVGLMFLCEAFLIITRVRADRRRREP